MANITAAMVKELREKTSAGMLDCKKALAATEGDMEAAVTWLRERGIAKAVKKEGAVAAEGLCYYAVSGNSCIVNEIKPTNQAACNAIAGGGGKLCYFSYDDVGYCMTIANVTAGAKKIFSSDSTSNICKDTNDLSCCWKHDSGYLCNNHAARSACSNYSINGNSNFSNVSRAKLSTAFKKSACKMITYNDYGSKDSCETDDGDNTYDGEGCEPFYYYTGQDGNKMQGAEFEQNTTKTVTNKAFPVRCATTVGTPN